MMKMYQGDLKPDLEITLSGTDGVDISDALAVRIIAKQNGVLLFDRTPDTSEVVGQTSVLTMQWQADDTAQTGRIGIEVEVMWPGSKPQTFRATSVVSVNADYDAT